MDRLKLQTLLIILTVIFQSSWAQNTDWEPLFVNGKDLSGWRELNGNHKWEVRDGMIIGTTVPGEPNGFLCTDKEYGDFVLELEVSVDTLMNNSGIQFRSLSNPDYKNGRVHGYQMEVDPKPQQWSGAIYEEGGSRGWLYPGSQLTPAAKEAFQRDNRFGYQWNRYRIECVGSVIRTWVNGVPAAHLIDNKFMRGFIGLQLHANAEGDPQGSHTVRFRNIRIQSGNLQLTPLDDIEVINLYEKKVSPVSKREPSQLHLVKDSISESIAVFRQSSKDPILTQIAKQDERPYLHPISAPDGKGILTEYRPSHHSHQTGIYWGLKLVNGRDYFMQWKSDYWRGVSATIIEEKGDKVKWQTVYDMLGENGHTIMVETQNWSLQDYGDNYVLDLEWKGEAKTDILMGKFYVGGLFVRMPWVEETVGEIVNAVGQQDMALEGQRAMWSDIGIKIDGRDDFAHIAIFDHPGNPAFPTPWRVDSQMGIGPSRQILGDWGIKKGETEIIRYRLFIYTGDRNDAELTEVGKNFWDEFDF
ncbi:family 16 glycoside hydrolase [Algoriphagus sp.]|uniref:family 16 glycoside hydrolase n=1 Tax=Algoriphagus sp. TaxID=1872435 RepID=UPI003F70EEEB